jgi:hypothetical protein
VIFGGSLTRFNPQNGEFRVFKRPGPMPTPYRLEVDHDDNVWYASMYTDVMGKLDPNTGVVTEYPSPYGERGTRDMVADAKGRIWYGAQPYFKAGYVRVRTAADRLAGRGWNLCARRANSGPLRSLSIASLSLRKRPFTPGPLDSRRRRVAKRRYGARGKRQPRGATAAAAALPGQGSRATTPKRPPPDAAAFHFAFFHANSART